MLLPPAIADHLLAIATRERAPAYLRVTPSGCLLDWGGAIERYDLHGLRPGDTIATHLFFLEGFWPLAAASEVLAGVHMDGGLIADVHLIAGSHEDWVLLLDTTAPMQERQQLQQKGNDLSLLRHRYDQLLQRCLASELAPVPPIASAQKEISVLLVKICGLTQRSQQISPALTLKAANACVSAIAQTIVEEGGTIDHLLGETVVALFGLSPTHQPAPQQAVNAAMQIARQFQATNFLQTWAEMDALGIGSGITTGRATVGIVRDRIQSGPKAFGTHIDRATQLATQISPGDLLVDGPTFQALSNLQPAFEPFEPETSISLPALYQFVPTAKEA